MSPPGWRWRAGLLALWAAFGLYALWGAHTVPFHPDESTFLFMSQDFDRLVLEGRPAAVTWRAEGQPALVARYRLLDAPMGRYLAGLGRALAGEPPLAQDWNWSASWEANVQAGALPSERALAAARLPTTLLTALSIWLIYGLGHRLGGRATGLAAAVLGVAGGLLLLHGRRAMSEGPLVFFSLLTIWLLLRDRPKPLLVALALAAAVASKLTALTLLPVAGLALLLPPAGLAAPGRGGWQAASRRLALFGVGLALALWALHPPLWSAPLAGLQAMRLARQDFLAEQTAFVQSIAPHVRLPGLGLRGLSLLYHLYFAPLAYADVSQYAAATAAAEQRYAALPLHTGLHTGSFSFNFVGGGLLLALTLVGVLQTGHDLWAQRRSLTASAGRMRARLVLAAWTITTVVGLLAIAVPAQRYYVPLAPIVCLWAAYPMTTLARIIRQALQPISREPVTTRD